MRDGEPFRLAHLSDPHLGPLARPRFKELLNKRALGLTNYGTRRRGRHDMGVLAAIIADLRLQGVDHTTITGDLINLGLESEFPQALDFLREVGPPEHVSLVPGNHDAYLHPPAGALGTAWGAYMRGDAESSDADVDAAGAGFPYMRRRGPIGIVGVSSAVPTWLLSAAGRIGAAQAGEVGKALMLLGGEGLFRIVLVHHPIATRGVSPLRRLTDAPSFREVLALCGAELVLHGHNHHASLEVVPGRDKPIPAIGVPSASMRPGSREPAAAYNVYEVGGSPGSWRCSAHVRSFTAGGIVEARRFDLHGA